MSLVSGIQYSTEILGKRNVIINGTMEVNQREFTSEAIANAAGFKYAADRFAYYNDRSTGAATLTRSTDVPTYAQSGINAKASIDCTVTTAFSSPTGTNEAGVIYSIEGHDYDIIRSGNATLSFWIKSNKTGTYSVGLRNSIPDRSYVTEYTIDVADTWEKKTISVPLLDPGGTWDYEDGIGLSVYWVNMTGTTYATPSTDAWLTGNYHSSTNQVNLFDTVSNYIRIANVQFEKGSIATEFERRSYGEELALCQRYYQQINKDGYANWLSAAFIQGYSTTEAAGVLYLPVPLRDITTASISHSGNWKMRTGVTDKSVTSISILNIASSPMSLALDVVGTSYVVAEMGRLGVVNDYTAWLEINNEL